MLLITKRCTDCLLCQKRTVASGHSRVVIGLTGLRVQRQEQTEYMCLHPIPPKEGPLPEGLPEDCPILKEGTILKANQS